MSTRHLTGVSNNGVETKPRAMRETGSTETHKASLASRAVNVLARGVKNFLGVNSSREVGVMLAKSSLAA